MSLRLPQRPNVPPASLAITVILEEKIPAATSSRDDHTQGMVTSSALGLTGRAGGEGGGGRRGAKRSRPPAPPQSERNFCAHLHISGNGTRPLGVSNILSPVYSTHSSRIPAAAQSAAVHTSASSQNSFASKPRRPSAGAAAAACARPRTSCARAAAIALLLAATLSLSTTAAAAAAGVGGSEFRTTAAGATTTSSRLCSPADDSRAYVTTIAPDDVLGDQDIGNGDDDVSLLRATFGGGEGGGAGGGEGQGGGLMGARVLAQSLRSAGAKGDVVVLVPLERATEANLEALRRDGLKVQVVPRAPQQQAGERVFSVSVREQCSEPKPKRKKKTPQQRTAQ